MRKQTITIAAAVAMAIGIAAASTDGWSRSNRDRYHDDNIGRDESFRGWRDQNGFLHGYSENPNMRGTAYCWANGVWICP